MDEGEKEVWMVEGGMFNILLCCGLIKKFLILGIVIIVDGYQVKDCLNCVNGCDVIFEDGIKIFMGFFGIGVLYDKCKKKCGGCC